jgi:hypothetical protein
MPTDVRSASPKASTAQQVSNFVAIVLPFAADRGRQRAAGAIRG